MAGIKSILLHVDATTASLVRLEVARQIAARHEARITALFAASRDAETLPFAYSAGAVLAARESEWSESTYDEARSRLERSVAGDGPPITWCEVVANTIARGFVEEAAYADLLVVGQQIGLPQAGAAPAGFVESMILDSGRPTLIIPPTLRASGVGRCVLVAWDGSVPAARALTSSLPFLEKADEVHVVSWSAHPKVAPFSRVDVGGYLREHHISAQLHRRDATTHVAEELASLAASVGANLVVMGCYGHSRMGERIFGGASRAALANMPVPVLMAH
jgi:nucleotide-binding universal stress UspA family protein